MIPKSAKLIKAICTSVAKMIRRDEIPVEQYDKLISIYPMFSAGINYALGDIVRYNQEVYEVIQPHTSQANWHPEITQSLFKKVVPQGVIPVWAQPTGSHDSYSKGSKVVYNGQIWVSTIANNVWTPGQYGWVLV